MALGILAACGRDEHDGPDDSVTVIIENAPVAKAETFKIPIEFAAGSEIGASDEPPSDSPALRAAPSEILLTDATAYRISVEGCVSRYTAVVSESQLDGLEVYRFDQGCKAKLLQFTLGGRTYFPTAGQPFTTWDVGDTAVFDEAGEPGLRRLSVRVMSQLGSPLVATDRIRYGISSILAGANRAILWSTIGTTGTIRVRKNPVPSFIVRKVELLNVPSTGQGNFRFTMECSTAMGGTNTCGSVSLASIDYKLVEDVYNGSPSKGQCDGIFSTAGSTVTLPTERIAPGTSGLVNGGFITKTISGPLTLASKPHMVLILRSNGASYQYHNIDVNVTPRY